MDPPATGTMMFMNTMSPVERSLQHDTIANKSAIAELRRDLEMLRETVSKEINDLSERTSHHFQRNSPRNLEKTGALAARLELLDPQSRQTGALAASSTTLASLSDEQLKFMKAPNQVSNDDDLAALHRKLHTLEIRLADASGAAPASTLQRSFEEKLNQQAEELEKITKVVSEMHANLPLHAVRASRIALRSSELSKEDRRQALASLDKKEEQIRAGIDSQQYMPLDQSTKDSSAGMFATSSGMAALRGPSGRNPGYAMDGGIGELLAPQEVDLDSVQRGMGGGDSAADFWSKRPHSTPSGGNIAT
jgi:hypothetical protein